MGDGSVDHPPRVLIGTVYNPDAFSGVGNGVIVVPLTPNILALSDDINKNWSTLTFTSPTPSGIRLKYPWFAPVDAYEKKDGLVVSEYVTGLPEVAHPKTVGEDEADPYILNIVDLRSSDTMVSGSLPAREDDIGIYVLPFGSVNEPLRTAGDPLSLRLVLVTGPPAVRFGVISKADPSVFLVCDKAIETTFEVSAYALFTSISVPIAVSMNLGQGATYDEFTKYEDNPVEIVGKVVLL